jgi:methenyltetrahydromethanopterin cyclohydrolase
MEQLNLAAQREADQLAADPERYRVAVHRIGGARVIDCGIAVPGGLEAGLALARIGLGGLATVTLQANPLTELADLAGLAVQVVSDHPVRACLASQYAGRAISVDRYFAMGSGPMRAIWGNEKIYDDIGGRESAPVAVGVLETRKLPTEAVIAHIAAALQRPPEALTLAVAPTASLAGTVQVVARCLETALHKLHELHFDLSGIVSGAGIAPLVPPAADDLAGIGRTNDAILYAGQVTLLVRTDDSLLTSVGPRVPSSASAAYGQPFVEVFRQAGGDFYRIDPLLFSPATVTFANLASGRVHAFGRPAPHVLRRSLAMTATAGA